MPNTVRASDTITHLAASTCGVVHARDLRAAGVSRGVVLGRIRAGSMRLLLPRTYAVGPQCHDPTFEMWCMAGVLSGGPEAALTGEAAARLLGTWHRGGTTIDVAIPGRGMRATSDRVRYVRLDASRRARGLQCGPVPVASMFDVLVHLARTLTKWQLANVIHEAIYRRLTTLAELERAQGSRGPVTGIAVLRDALRLARNGSAGTRTVSEDILVAALLDAGAPEPIVNTRGSLGLSRDEPDLLWRAPLLLNVEIDGDQHLEPSQAADDARRDAEAEALGALVLRVPWRWVHQPARRGRVVKRILAALRGA